MGRKLQHWSWNRARFKTIFATILAVFSAGCGATRKTPARPPSSAPVRLLTATKQQLVASYNAQASAIHSVNASVSMKLIAGTAYSGIIQQYHEIKGFMLAQKPASIRVIGQAPIVGTNIFDMASDGETFAIYIPSKSKFVTGPANLQRPSAKPIENLRPQHLTEALFWDPVSQSTTRSVSGRRRIGGALLYFDHPSECAWRRQYDSGVGKDGRRLADRARSLVRPQRFEHRAPSRFTAPTAA